MTSEMVAIDPSAFKARAQEYLGSLIDKRFPQPHLLSLFGVLDPGNASSAFSGSAMELASAFGIDPPKLWNEFRFYKTCVNNLQPPHITAGCSGDVEPNCL